MKSTNTLILILISFFCFQYSCKSNLQNEFSVGDYKLKIEIPKSFLEISTDEVNKISEEGKEISEHYGYKVIHDQRSIFFYRKGEFSLLKAKKYELEQNFINDYKVNWSDMKGILFNILAKQTSEMDGATIDSLSNIKKINGIEFYIFETNVYLLDLNNNQVNLKSLRYSTPIGNQDLVIDASFINQADGVDIIESLKSLRIEK